MNFCVQIGCNTKISRINSYRDIFNLIPTFGILAFCGLYLYSASLYPGGSQTDINSVGFDWVDNYWCNLMNEKGMNGIKNPARPIAISAMIMLCASLTFFFFQFSVLFEENKAWKWLIRIFGTLSMVSAVLIFTSLHDIMTTVSSILGVVVLFRISRNVYKSDWTIFKVSGVVCILLLGINNFIYYSEYFIGFLPLVQKITFVLVLAWIVGLNLELSNGN